MSATLREKALRGERIEQPVLDAHGHIGQFAALTGPDLSIQIQEMDRLGIDRTIVSAVEALHGDILGGNDDVARACERFPEHLWGYCHVTAQQPEHMATELERCFANPCFRGIKIYQVGTDFDHALFDDVWAFAKERGVPVLAHTWGGNLTGLDRAAERYPTVPVLAAHSGSDFAWQAYVDAVRRVPNLYLDITYSREFAGMLEIFVREAGVDRIVWGSDAPCFSMSHQLGKVLLARISEEDKHKILFGTAARLFNVSL